MVFVRKTKLLVGILPIAGALLVCSPVQAAGELDRYDPGNIGQALAVIIVFVLLVLVLGKWAWKPLIGQLRRREKDITDALANARRREKEATDLLDMYKARLEAAEGDAEVMLANTRAEAVELREQTIEEGRLDARKSAEQGREELERARREAVEELRDATAEMASDIAGKILRKDLSPEDRKRLFDSSLEEIEKRASEE